MTDELQEMEPQAQTETPVPPQDAKDAKAAIIIGPIIVQSAATPLVALVMLAAGLMVGYLAHPFVSGRLAAATPTLLAATAIAARPEEPASPTEAAIPATEASVSNAEPPASQREELMTYLIAGTTHFIGNPEASVTLIEFSDFQ